MIGMTHLDSDNLKLTDFLDLNTLQEIQDGFAAVANVRARITDGDGKVLTNSELSGAFKSRQSAIADASRQVAREHGPVREGTEYVAPIIVNDQRVGTLRMDADSAEASAIHFLTLLANAIARLCFQEFQLRQRINELTAVYNVTMMLSDARDLQNLLNRTVEVVCHVMETKSASLRLVDRERDQLVIKAAYNLSAEYLNKGAVQLGTSAVDLVALSPKGYEFVRDMTTDPRIHYSAEARQEGIVSMLSVGMRYQGRPIGVLRVYTETEQTFTQLRIDLMKALAAQAAAAIENARLRDEALAAQQLEHQVKMAAEVQQRMIPQAPPNLPALELARAYAPSYGLGGDFLDFITLPYNNLGLAIADVSGKGIPASLTMASVRAALRAQVDNVYYLDEVVRRINVMVCRDAKVGEFVTLFYGVLDAANRRLTYCNAGHPPAMLLRNGQITELRGENMVLGILPEEKYTQKLIDLVSGDLLLLYTDGLTDAMNFQNQTYGRQRLVDAFKQIGALNPPAETVTEHILWDMRRFAGLNRRNDDVTMIVVKVK